MLLIGPNEIFLNYISEVLPTLGKGDIVTSTVENLFRWRPVKIEESEESIMIKGADCMVGVLKRAVADIPRILDETLAINVLDHKIEVSPNDSINILNEISGLDSSYEKKRNIAFQRYLNLIYERFILSWENAGLTNRMITVDPNDLIQKNRTYRQIMNRTFPDSKPEEVLHKLKSSPSAFFSQNAGHLNSEEIEEWIGSAISKKEEIYPSDVPLLQYLSFLMNENIKNWGHIAIDEAQDLTPMELKALGTLLGPSGTDSLTGDLAQATGLFMYETWEDIIDSIGYTKNYNIRELKRSYRVPSEIIEYAQQFLDKSEVTVSGSEPFLNIAESLRTVITKDDAETFSRSIEILLEELTEDRSVLVIAPDSFKLRIRKALLVFIKSNKLHLLHPLEVKGLEFDSTLIIEPEKVIKELGYGLGRIARILYVLTTRSTKSLILLGQNEYDLANPLLDLEIEGYVQEFDTDTIQYDDADAKELEGSDLSNDEISKSVRDYCSEFGFEISSPVERFNTGDWFFLGLSQQKCVNCGTKPQYVFRRHYVSERKGQETVYHYWAIVCTRCRTILDGNSYDRKILDSIDQELQMNQVIFEKCRQCVS